MTEAIIHFTGEFSADHVETTRSDAPHPVPPQVQEKIESAWIAAGRRIGPKLFDGPMIRLNSWRIEKDRLILDLGRTSYKPFMGTNLMHPELADQCGADVLANPLGLSAALESADGFLLFGRRNPDMAFYPNRIHPFAGTAETADVFAEIRKELQEEAGLLDADISELRCIGMAEDRAIRQPELIFHARSNLRKSEIEQRLNREEHAEIIAIACREEEIRIAMRREDLTPIAAATLKLWNAQ